MHTSNIIIAHMLRRIASVLLMVGIVLASLSSTAADGVWNTPDTINSLKETLISLGYSPDPPGAEVGPATRAAIRQFQADNDLPVVNVLHSERTPGYKKFTKAIYSARAKAKSNQKKSEKPVEELKLPAKPQNKIENVETIFTQSAASNTKRKITSYWGCKSREVSFNFALFPDDDEAGYIYLFDEDKSSTELKIKKWSINSLSPKQGSIIMSINSVSDSYLEISRLVTTENKPVSFAAAAKFPGIERTGIGCQEFLTP